MSVKPHTLKLLEAFFGTEPEPEPYRPSDVERLKLRDRPDARRRQWVRGGPREDVRRVE